jgi:hypothetical protein
MYVQRDIEVRLYKICWGEKAIIITYAEFVCL